MKQKNVELLCPTCGESFFKLEEGFKELPEKIKCAHCGRIITKEELIRENKRKIINEFEDMKRKTFKEIEKKFKK